MVFVVGPDERPGSAVDLGGRVESEAGRVLRVGPAGWVDPGARMAD